MNIDFESVKRLFPERNENSNKGTFGTALIVSGSYGMAGAACLCAGAAIRSGCGLVKEILPKSIYPVAALKNCEAVFYPMCQNEFGGLSSNNLDRIMSFAKESTAVLVGCGMQNTDDTFAIVSELIRNHKKPLVIDADGINSLSSGIDILRESQCMPILTPHPKEFSRICCKGVDEIEAARERSASDFAQKYGCVVVLKGHNTVIAVPNGKTFINHTGNSGMAKGGSGDVLGGIIVSLLAQGMSSADAAIAGVFIHGMAGDIAAKKYSVHAMTAGNIIDCLPDAFLRIEENE